MATRLFLIDSFGFIFRAYHARARSGAPPMRTATGLPTEAVFIFHNMLKKLIASQKPERIAAVFESEGPTFRDEAFADYKANRAPMPEDLSPQIPWVRKILEAMRIPVLEFPGFEADDVIGTLARRAEAAGDEVVIVSSDKDMLQLVTPRVSMLNPMKPDPPREFTLYDPAKTQEFMGVRPEHIADLLALKGDAIDNIPGAPGIGDKGAKDLVQRFGPVENILDHAAEVERKMYRESLQNHREQVLLSKRLATIDCAVPIQWDPAEAESQPPDSARLRELYRDLEFFSLMKELGSEPKVPVAIIDLPELDVDWVFVYDLKNHPELHEREDVLDVMLAGFLVLADPGAISINALAERFLRREVGPSSEEHAEAIFALGRILGAEIDSLGLLDLYRRIDRPLAPVLSRLESAGIGVNLARLGALNSRIEGEIAALTATIHAQAGREFNINSPQQLGKVLFEDLGLAPQGKTRTKQQSTAADVLESLAAEGHEIAGSVLEYRQLTKLKGTYVDALPSLIRPETGRVHTTFNQCGAATGRLSSNNPNLQNIPIRTELGREIRSAFVPEPGWKLVVADYSQIELRLLAHMSEDKVLIEAFVQGEDIHTRTAAEVFGVAPLMVTPEMRRNAKAVNFGIVYGQTPFGLAQAIGVPRSEAERYIRGYFDRYAGVRRFIDKTIAEVRRDGFARTLDGRRRPIPDINSRNPNARGFAERTAVNTPLQGTAADLIKLAMIRLDAVLRADGWRSRMLLQVHDELVFEAPPAEAEALAKLVKREMEGVARLKVPLVVDTGIGENWRDAK
ncbi:MAG: DNA polymerase I [Bryobacteraceae bacterium]|nr:DNA polymerase I [Bryobacteraceae bacterium]